LPNIKAAVKWARQSERRTIRNRDIKTRLKTLFKKARLSGDTALAAGVESQFDKAAGKGVIHPNKAARKKSRLARAVRAQAALSAAPKVAVAKTPGRKKTKA
jgi:small subunit ribosomal protein S20